MNIERGFRRVVLVTSILILAAGLLLLYSVEGLSGEGAFKSLLIILVLASLPWLLFYVLRWIAAGFSGKDRHVSLPPSVLQRSEAASRPAGTPDSGEPLSDRAILDAEMLNAVVLKRLGDERPPFDLPCPLSERPEENRKFFEADVTLYQLRIFVDTVRDTYGHDFAKAVNDSLKEMLPPFQLSLYETHDQPDNDNEDSGEPLREIQRCIWWLSLSKDSRLHPPAGLTAEETSDALFAAALSDPDGILGIRWLLAARQRSATLHRVVMRTLEIDPRFPRAAEVLRWNARPGCFEGRLKSRFENPLSEDTARQITQSEILAARAQDTFDAWLFDKEWREFMESFGRRPDLAAMPVGEVLDVIQSLDRLIARGLELGGPLDGQMDILEKFRGDLLGGIQLSEDPAEAGPRDYIAGLVALKKRLAFFSRCTRDDAPMKDAELPMALLQEDPATISTTLKAIDEADTGTGFSAMLRRECLTLLNSAEQKGIRIPRAEEKRAVLEAAI